MAEYIEREALENALEDENKNGNFVFTANWIMEILDNLPPADVVPKSEYDGLKEMLNATIAGQETLQKALANAKAEIEREIFEEIENIAYTHFDVRGDEESLEILIDEFAELKKKYTEEHK